MASRKKSASPGKGGKVKALLRRAGRQSVAAFKRIPRPLQIVTLYLVILVLVGGFFLWRTAMFRSDNPYAPEYITNQFNWGEEPFGLGQEGDAGSAAGSQPVAEDESQEPAVTETVAGGHLEEPAGGQGDQPQPAIWPLPGGRDNLYYRFKDFVAQPSPKGKILRESKGIGIKGTPGEEVKAIWDGKVTKVTRASVTVQHTGGYTAYYELLREVPVYEGRQVAQGETLGCLAAGSGGEPAHLYLEIKDSNNEPVDPLSFLP